MKTLLIAGALALACSGLGACLSPAAVTGAVPAPVAASGVTLTAADVLAAQKEANRHFELCHRSYTFAWPPTGTIDCPATSTSPASTTAASLTAADVEAIVSKAISAALAPPASK